MDELDVYLGVVMVQVVGEVLSAIYAAVLPSRAAETEHEVGEASLYVSLHMVLS